MASTIKVRTAINGDIATVRMLVKHPMDVGGRRKNGEVIAPHYIREISCSHNGEVVMLGHWGAGVAKNPYLSFTFSGAQAGDALIVKWRDNQGARDEFKALL